MEVTTSRPEWDEVEDRDIWFQFLKTRTGSRLLPKLLESCPMLLASGQTNDILIRSGEVRGIQIVTQALLALSVPEPKPETGKVDTTYPQLDDDDAWKDGHSVKPK